MADRELVMLGTASRTPTRERNLHATALCFDGEVILFDPGEGAQRQLLRAGLSAPRVTRILITHFHGDHCLGLPGVLQGISAQPRSEPADVVYPASGQPHFDALAHVAAMGGDLTVRSWPSGPGMVLRAGELAVTAARLDHRVDALGYRVQEPGGRRLLPERLEAAGVAGADIGQLQRDGAIEVGGRTVTLEEVSEPRAGRSVAFVMDTRWCDGALALAADVDVLVCEATFVARHAHLAPRYGHLTAAQAGALAARAGARRLVLTHFSQRCHDAAEIAAEARLEFDDVVVADDLTRVGLPPRD